MSKFILQIDSCSTLNEALELLDMNGNGILPVVDLEGQLVGVITDGDVRKAVLNDELTLNNIINKKPKTLNVKSTYSQRISYLKNIKRRQLPLVDDLNIFQKMFTLDEIDFNQKPNWVVIMAGGLGTRLGELTKETPKPMLTVKGRPILERIIDGFIEQGFSNFYISVNYKKEVIKEYFKNGEKLGVTIKYIEEGIKQGTAGALSIIEEKMMEPIIVINGDVLSTIDYGAIIDFHLQQKSIATMCVKEYEHIVPYGVVETSGDNIIGFREKPRLAFNINSGVYVLSDEAISLIPKKTYFDMPDLFDTLSLQKMRVLAYKSTGYWADLGKPDDLIRANRDYS